MKKDLIIEIGIDRQERLYLKPKTDEFPHIYREAMEVHWDAEGKFLYAPKPREWNYKQWFAQIIKAAKEQGCELEIGSETAWCNISDQLKKEIQG